MIVTNITFCIDERIADAFRRAVREQLSPSALDSGCTDTRLMRVMSHSEPGTSTYALHIGAPDFDTAADWLDGHGAEVLTDMRNRWADSIVWFVTHLQDAE